MLISLFGNFVFISEIPEHEARSFMVKPELESQNMKSEAKAEDDIMSTYPWVGSRKGNLEMHIV